MNRFAVSWLAGFLAVAPISVRAAKAPVSAEELKKQAHHILSGRVIKVISKNQKSKVEKAWGIHRDRIFRIKLNVKTVSKGAGIKTGDEIEVVAWQPACRLPPLPGLQGHESIPKQGDAVTVYLKDKKENTFEPILPNGIKIVP